jgi:hypothetical protein
VNRRSAGGLLLGTLALLGAPRLTAAVVYPVRSKTHTRVKVGTWGYTAYVPTTFRFKHSDELVQHYTRKGWRLPSLGSDVFMLPEDQISIDVGFAQDAHLHVRDAGTSAQSRLVFAEWELDRRS